MNETLEPDLELNPEAEPGTERRKGKKQALFIAGGVLLILLLAGAAFVGGRLLNNPATADNLFAGGPLGEKALMGGDPGEVSAGGVTSKLNVLPAKELPATEPDTSGIFVRREDNSVFIGTGKMTIGVTANENGQGEADSDFDGPVVEVVVTQETKLYKDATQFKGEPEAEATIQQEVAPGSLDELGTNSMVTVWGKKVGDRIIAEVMMYSEPEIMFAPKDSGP